MLTNWAPVGMGGVLTSAWEKPSDDRPPPDIAEHRTPIRLHPAEASGRLQGRPVRSLATRPDLALATGKTRQELYAACPSDRPNHVGIAVQRHIRAGRIQERDGKFYATSTATERSRATA